MAGFFRVGLQRLQEGFSKTVDAGDKLQCCLILWTARDGEKGWSFDRDPPISSRSHLVYCASHVYQADRGACRMIQLFGQLKVRNQFLPLASDAGNLLTQIPANVFPVVIPPATLGADDAELRWFYLLFDLAWAKVAGSPLRVCPGDLSCLSGRLSLLDSGWGIWPIPEDDLQFSYSAIADVARASVYAIDILLATQSLSGKGGIPLHQSENRWQPMPNNKVSSPTNSSGAVSSVQSATKDAGAADATQSPKRRQKQSAWLHSPQEQKPSDFGFGPIIALGRDLEAVLYPESKAPGHLRYLKLLIDERKLWVQGRRGQELKFYFSIEAESVIAKQKMEAAKKVTRKNKSLRPQSIAKKGRELRE